MPGSGGPSGLWLLSAPPCHPPRVPTGPFYHGNPGVESKIAPFWVMPPPEVSGAEFGEGSGPPQSCGVTPGWLPHPQQRPNDYGIPMDVEVSYIQDGFLTNDVVQEMVREGWGSPKPP